MKGLSGFIAALGLAFSAYGAWQDNFAWVALGLIVALSSVALVAMAASRRQRLADVFAPLTQQERTVLSPIRKLRSEIESISTQAQSETVRMIAKEALDESNHIIEQAVRMVSIRTDILKALSAEVSATREAGELRSAIEAADEGEKGSLESALQSRERESGHYASLRKSLDQIESTLKQAEAALAEMKAKLAVSAALPPETEEAGVNLREGMDRLRALSVSFDEAEQLFEGRSV